MGPRRRQGTAARRCPGHWLEGPAGGTRPLVGRWWSRARAAYPAASHAASNVHTISCGGPGRAAGRGERGRPDAVDAHGAAAHSPHRTPAHGRAGGGLTRRRPLASRWQCRVACSCVASATFSYLNTGCNISAAAVCCTSIRVSVHATTAVHYGWLPRGTDVLSRALPGGPYRRLLSVPKAIRTVIPTASPSRALRVAGPGYLPGY